MFRTRLAYENWATKYQYGNETPLETQIRAAKALASVEKPEEREYWENKFLNTLVKFENNSPLGLKFTLGGRITANIGTKYKGTTLMNCFINGPVKDAQIFYTREVPGTDKFIVNNILTDKSPDSLANIFLTILEQAETLKSEGGYGINFGFIRPRGSLIKGIGIQHPGVVKYMEIWDKVSEIIVQGNNDGYKDILKNYLTDEQIESFDAPLKKMARKGAMMAVLPVFHPDIEEFVRAKQTPGRLTKFNISVGVTDDFMVAVENDDIYELKFNGIVYKKVKARELYELIMQSTYNRAEPGILYIDSMQRNNPISYLGPLDATNPCGEIGGNPVTSTVCLLGSLNLTQYVRKDRTFDWDLYVEDIRVAARMLDNVNDLTDSALPQYRWATTNIRQYGMGINGLGSALFMMGIPYNSQAAIEFTEKVNSLKEEHTWDVSADLAAEKGPFPAYTPAFLETEWFTQFTQIPEYVKEKIRKNGVRNAKTTTNPPLGNSSVVCDNVSNSIEPIFSLEYDRTYISDSWPEGLNVDNVKTILKETKAGDATVWRGEFNGVRYHYEPHNRGLCIVETVMDYGYAWVKENYPEDIVNKADYIVTTSDLKVEDHVAIQAAVQRHVNQSVSKTANIPNDYPFEDFKNLYIAAWKSGLNGFTTYREGSMEAVLSKIDEKDEKSEISIVKSGIELPDEFVNGPTKVITREGMKFYIHFSYLPEDDKQTHPIAMWIYTNHKGETVAANHAVKRLAELLRQFEIDNELIEAQLEKVKGNQSHNKIAKMVSMCLRHNLPIASIVVALENLEEDYISSLVTAVRKFLGSVVKDGTKVVGRTCSACGSENLAFEAGCSKCLECGSAACG